MKGHEIEGLNTNCIRIINELNQEEPQYEKITEIIETDLGLSYKILKLANSAFFGSSHKIYSIKQALVRLGITEIKKWVYIMMLKEVQSIENKELIKSSLIRAKLMELLSQGIGMKHKRLEFFLTGMFSSIDVLLNRGMEDIVKELSFEDDVKEALQGKDNNLRQSLDIILNHERLNFSEIEENQFFNNITQEKYTLMYIEALKWVMTLDY